MLSGDDRVPYRPVLSIRAVWCIAAGWAPFVLLIHRTRAMLAGAAEVQDVACVAAGLVAICAAARKAAAAPSRSAAVGWAFASWAMAGALWVTQLRIPVLATMLFMLVPMATVAGAWQVGLAARLYPALRAGTHEKADRAMATAATWVALPFLLYGLAAGLFDGAQGVSDFLRSPVALIALPPLAVVLLAKLRVSDRRRWLRLVHDGLVADWRIVDARATAVPRGLPLLVGDAGESGTPLRILERTRVAEDPFRAADAEPFALIGEIPGLSAPPRGRPPAAR